MLFSKLLSDSGLPARCGGNDAEITSVSADSRRCREHCCFVALRGTHVDGHDHIPHALQCGASAVVCEDPSGLAGDVPHAVVEDTRLALGPLAQAVHDWPARKLTCIGVTGTNGKTTVAHLLQHILGQGTGQRCGMIGTIRYDTGEDSTPAPLTTPDAADVAELMARMCHADCNSVVMEVSSHALDQHRTAGVDFAVGIFTNLSGDHLDYHGDMEAYLVAKRRLFETLKPGAVAVINRDDPAADRMAEAASDRVVFYGLSPLADVQARIASIDASGSRFEVLCGDRSVEVSTSLIGRHNVYNALAALATCEALEMDLGRCGEALESLRVVPGRLQRVESSAGFDVFVDYAHTDDALANVLGALRPLTPGRLIVVFGCGGDRDRTKRPRMAAVAERDADVVVVTSDNPRSEPPEAIVDEIFEGFTPAGQSAAKRRVDREEAIALALSEARKGDVVLIAGKGHESCQILGSRRVAFDDAEVAGRLLSGRAGAV